MYSIHTVVNIICCHPLVCILSSLCCNTCDLSWSAKVNLQPLIVIVVTRNPRTSVPTLFGKMQSGTERSMEFIPLGGGSESSILYCTSLKTLDSVIETLWERGWNGMELKEIFRTNDFMWLRYMLCYITVRYVILRYFRNVTSLYMLRYITFCCVMIRYLTFCCVMIRYVTFWCDVLWSVLRHSLRSHTVGMLNVAN